MRFAVLLAIWTVPAVLVTGQLYVQLQNAGRSPSLITLLLLQCARWWPWALVTPWLQALARRRPPVGPGRIPNALTLIGLGSLLLVASAAYGQLVDVYLFQGQSFEIRTALVSLSRALLTSLPVFVVAYGGVLGSAWAMDAFTAHQRRQLEAQRLRAALAEARLQALQVRLQPHFLFNTLHVIASLMDEDTKLAQRMTAQLAELLRAVLDRAEESMVPLREEVAFARLYLAIEQTRFEGRLNVSWDLAPEALQWLVPTLSLQPLVENAIRHGVTRVSSAGRIEICAAVVDGMLRLEVIDDGAGPPDRPDFGVGLSSVEGRLQQLFGSRGGISLKPRPPRGCRALLTVPSAT